MSEKYSIFLLIASILITNLAEIQSLRGPRDYGETLPASRSSIPKTLLKINETIIPLKANVERKQESDGNGWEPSACTNCLNDRYLAHYLAKGCKPIDNGLFCRKPCPKYFECPKKDLDIVMEGCEYKGKVYKFGERLEHDNPCQQGCFCNPNRDEKNMTNPEITCAHVDCFNNFRAPTPNCFTVWEEGKCCSKEKCLTQEEAAQETKCLYAGKQYHSGQYIDQKEDPCLKCTCDQNWNQTNPLKSKGCTPVKCDIELNSKRNEGCIPIYHEKTCCPIQYFCPPPEKEQCKFNGKNYMIGERLEINEERVECTCRIPPEFTCIKKVAEDYIKKFQTLPKIRITDPSNNPLANIPELNQESKCPPFVPGGLSCAGTNCTTIIDKDGCQVCKCKQPCPKLKCGLGCNLFATNPGACPQCQCNLDTPIGNIPDQAQNSKCPPFVPGGLNCAGTNCITIIDKDGCQACKCEQPCPELKCGPGCNLFATTPGVCPQCQCN